MTGSFTYWRDRIQFDLEYSAQPKEASTGTALTFTLESVRAIAVRRLEKRGYAFPIHAIVDYDLSEAVGELEEQRLADKYAWAEMCAKIEASEDSPDIPIEDERVVVGGWA